MGTLQIFQALQIPRGYSNEGDQFLKGVCSQVQILWRSEWLKDEQPCTDRTRGQQLRIYTSVLLGDWDLRKKRTAMKWKLKLFSKYMCHHNVLSILAFVALSSVWIHLGGALKLEEVSHLVVTGSRKDLRNLTPCTISVTSWYVL